MKAYAWRCRRDDLTRTQLRAQLAEMRPCELVLPSLPLSEATRKVLKAALRSPRTSKYSAADSAASVVEMLEEKEYFVQWPEVLTVGSGHLPPSLGGLIVLIFANLFLFTNSWTAGQL